jgi:hypothetical protein
VKIQTAVFTPYGSEIIVALVPIGQTAPDEGDAILTRLQPCFPTHPIMLVSVEKNGFRSFAAFQTGRLLALLQLEYLHLTEIDTNTHVLAPPALPF